MAGVDNTVGTVPGVSSEFLTKAQNTILNLGTTDTQLMRFLQDFYTGDNVSEAALQVVNSLMNTRSQRSSLISNIEDKRHNGAMSIISNIK